MASIKLKSRLHRYKLPAKKRDWWEKAPVIISAVSSVVLAGTGLYISSSFQKTQSLITQQNNAALYEMSKQKNAADLRLQELKTATDLMEPLLSTDKRKRQIALIMLPHTVSDEVMSHQILVIATQDQDPEVRLTALKQMSQSSHASVAAQLQTLSTDLSRPAAERALASSGATQVSLRSAAPANSIVYFASMPGKYAFESDAIGGGIFTSVLLKALSSQDLFGSKGPVTTSTLGKYLVQEVGTLTGNVSPAYVEDNLNQDAPVFASALGQRTFALVVGVGDYQNVPSLKYANSDAEKVASVFKSSGATVTLLRDPTQSSFLQSYYDLLKRLRSGDKMLIYYSGHGFMLDGENRLMMSDSMMNDTSSARMTSVSITSMKNALSGSNPSSSLWFLDVCQAETFGR